MKKILLGILATFILLLLVFGVLNYHADLGLETLKKDWTYADSKFIDVSGMEVHYRVTGSGPPLVLLHGTGASLHTWEGWTEQLSDHYQIISLDLPAFGLTGPHIDRDYTMASYSRFLDTFFTSIGIDTFALAGNSLGGRIAWTFALDYPERVKQLVLIDATGYLHEDRPPPFAFRLAKNPLLGKILLKITPKSLMVKSLKEVYHQDELLTDATIDRYFKLYLRTGNRQAFVDRANQKYVNRTNELKNLTIPTLIMWGAEDLWVPLGDARAYKNDLPNAELIVYPEAGHIPMEEIPEETAVDVHQFLQKHIGTEK